MTRQPLYKQILDTCEHRKYGLCWQVKECKYKSEKTYEIKLPDIKEVK
jgi:hypothetical protein